MDWADYDIHYWHPDGTPPGEAADLPRSGYGFPVVPGLLAAAVRPFVARGLQMPWLTVFGNHDGLLQGTIAEIPAFGSIATGADKIIGLAPGTDLQLLFSELLANNPAVLALLLGGPTRQVTADPDRRLLSRAQVVQEHFNTTGHPRGHGYTSQNVANGTAYYTFGRGAIRFIVMDTVNQGGGPNGSLDRPQFGWLEQQLIAGSSRYLDTFRPARPAARPGPAVRPVQPPHDRHHGQPVAGAGQGRPARARAGGARPAAAVPQCRRLGQRPHPHQPAARPRQAAWLAR